jgi:hypothetical protein
MSVGAAMAAAGLAHQMPGACRYCSSSIQATFHSGACPRIRSIEYHQDGTVKRVELHPMGSVPDTDRGA